VLKSGVAIADLLRGVGATSAYIAHEEQLLRREVRAEAQRLANADAANVRRAVAAASDQVRLVEHAVDVLGWDVLEEDLRDVALARLANPSASLAELGQLCDPPVGKSAVHRRLGRLRALVDEAESGN
jgi:DNA-binding protein WhiA